MKSSYIAATVLVILLVTGGVLFTISNGSDNKNPAAAAYTFDEIERHNGEDDCWTVIDGVVYDITSYVQRHPGGDEILRACGEDGTTLFNSRTTEEGEKVGSGTPHSTSAASQLSSFKIGTLAN